MLETAYLMLMVILGVWKSIELVNRLFDWVERKLDDKS